MALRYGGRQSAVNDNCLANNVRRFFRRQKGYDVCDFLGRAKTLEQNFVFILGLYVTGHFAVMSVSINPGTTALTRTPLGPSSAARLRVNAISAPFEAA